MRGLGGGHAAMRRFGVAMVVSASAMGLFALLQSLSWGGKIYGFRASPIVDGWRTGGPFVGHNPLAASLNLALGLGLSGPVLRCRGSRAWGAYAASLIIVGIVSSHSRSGLMATMVAAAVMALLLRGRVGVQIGGVLAVIAAMTVLLLAIVGETSAYHRLGSLRDGSAYSDRLEIWGAAAQAWAAHPYLGSGLGCFGVAAGPSFRHGQGVIFARAENEPLDLLVEGGLLGLGMAFVGVAAVGLEGVRAVRQAPTESDRALAAGGLFGLTALAVQSLFDFSPHIPRVAIPAVVLCGHVCDPTRAGKARPVDAGPRMARSVAAGLILAVLGLALALVYHDFGRARSESKLAGTGHPTPGAGTPMAIPRIVTKAALERMQSALELALLDRPDWGKGHLRLGMTHLDLYEREAAERLGDSVDNPAAVAQLADPLWLHATVHSAPHSGVGWGSEVIGHEPLRRHLVPATRCFLDARRSSPALASAHAHLAILSYLIDG
ncbi:O-antigen ligase family protein [Isosphaeraceae bacterium EP7]